MLSNLVDGTNIWMVQRRRRLCLTLEPLQRPRIVCNIVRKELQRDKTAQIDVFCFVYNAHPATAELFDNSVVRDGLIDHEENTSVRGSQS